MTSSNDRHQGWEGQVEDKHLEKIICLKLGILLVIMELWRHALMKLSHNGLWGRKLYVFMKKQWSSEAFWLEGSMKHRHQDQARCARKRYGLARFIFYQYQGVCWDTGLYDSLLSLLSTCTTCAQSNLSLYQDVGSLYEAHARVFCQSRVCTLESAYFVSLMFCVLDNNIRNFKCVLSGADFTVQELAKSLGWHLPVPGRIIQLGAG
jgi:hypothetical protein